MPMNPASLLQLIWLASPALPIGGFSYSEVFEAAVESGRVSDESEARGWLGDQLHLSLARSDLPVLARAIAAWRAGDGAQVNQLNDWMIQTRESAELCLQTVQMGRSMAEWLRQQRPEQHSELKQALGNTDPTYPIAFALAVSHTQADIQNACLAFAFGWAENMVAAAVKSVPLGQSAGQRILAHLAAAIPMAVEQAVDLPDEDRQAFSPMLAILSAQHEIQYSRLFRS